MQKFKIGDKIRVLYQGKEDHTSTIVEILEDYSGNMYWLKNENGRCILESETPETVFEKVIQ
jgi:hypothetical protein